MQNDAPLPIPQFLRQAPGHRQLRAAYITLVRLYKTARRIGTHDEQWLRVTMNHEILKIVNDLAPRSLKVLEISGDFWATRVPFKSYTSVSYPGFDVCRTALDETFHLIIAEQVFEHLLWPYRAGKNVYKMLNPGGSFIVTTPFLLRVHDCPVDCSRWTETGLKYLLAECGFDLEKTKTGSWGNRPCVRANFAKWAYYRPGVHSLQNEHGFPVSVWAIATK
jgi:hypothetical protein